MDGCTSHFSSFMLDECTYSDVFPMKEPPGTSDQIQPLDLGIFCAQKVQKKTIKDKPDLKQEENNILKIVESWQKATTPSNVVSAFKQAGIYMERVSDQVVMRADIKHARSVRNYVYEPYPNGQYQSEHLIEF